MYSRLLDKHPIITKAVSSGLLFSLGDAITQFGMNFLIQPSRNARH
jgi:hypothetical protein